jgi:hypothetical protein
MPKTENKSMTTKAKLKEALRLLGQAPPEQVEVVDLPDGSINIHYLPSKPDESVTKEKGKWAKAAEELSREAPLTGLGKEFLKHTKRFRKNFALKSPFSETE